MVDDGHVIGSHGHYHARMSHLTDEGIADDVQRAEEAIGAACRAGPASVVPLPIRRRRADERVLARSARGVRHVGWHVDSKDWAEARPPKAERRVRVGSQEVGDGAVVLLHGWPDVTPTALERLLAGAADEG